MALEHLIASALCGFAKLLTGVRARWRGSAPEDRRRVYFGNHTSHADFVLIWASLPEVLRCRTRPVAASDYWLKGKLRCFIVERVFRAVLVDRTAPTPAEGPTPVDRMGKTLEAGESLIIFPEGTRNPGEGLLPFKSGIYRLAQAHPEVEFVPVWIGNLGRVMPKGALVPVPLLCTLTFGQPLKIAPGEDKDAFLARSRESLLALAPGAPGAPQDRPDAHPKAWWVMAALLALALWIGFPGVIGLFAFVSFQCLREFFSLAPIRSGDHGALAWSFFLFLPLQYLLVGTDRYGLFSTLIPAYAFLLLPILSVRRQWASEVSWGLMAWVYCLSHVPALMTLEIPGYGGKDALLAVFLIVTVQGGEVFQRVWGRQSPDVSPSKAVVGLAGGVLASTAVGAGLWWMTPFLPRQAALVALAVGAAGFLGGSVLSAIRRDRGAVAGGRDGMLDKVAPLVLSAPVFFHIVRYWWVP